MLCKPAYDARKIVKPFHGATQVLDTLAEIRERRDAVMELEKSLMELHQVPRGLGV